MQTGAADTVYDSHYYEAYTGGVPYSRDHPQWAAFFGGIADHIVRDIAPTSSLDAGCAKGFLVEALRDRGIEAYGIDASSYAVSEVREDIRAHCRVATLTEPLDRDYDLVTCFEVLEHLPVEEADAAVANLCAHAEDVLFSSTPDDHQDPTHLNVRPAEYWVELFARHGFVHDLDYDASYIAPWAMRLRRSRDHLSRQAAAYERELVRLRTSAGERDRTLQEQWTRLAELGREVADLRAQLDADAMQTENRRLAQELERAEIDLARAERRAAEAERRAEEVGAITHSPAWMVARGVSRGLRRAFPQGSRRGDALTRAGRGTAVLLVEGPGGLSARLRQRRAARSPVSVDFEREYARWLAENEPAGAALRALVHEVRSWPDRPLVSVVMPVYNSEPEWLEEAVDSLLAQAYDRWELCIADDASPRPHVAETLAALQARDDRVRVVRREANGGIAAASQSALEMARGDLVTFLDHDDVLRPHALAEMVRRFRAVPDTGMAYSDEDKILGDGRRGEPFFKPDWSPALLLSTNYLCHQTVIRRELVEQVGGFRPGYDGSQDHDLFLRVADTGCRVEHVPLVLYSWRMVAGSAAASTTAKPYAHVAGVRAVEDSLRRRGLEARVEDGPHAGRYVVRPTVPDSPEVTIVIPTRDRLPLLARCIQSIGERTTYPRHRLLIVDNDSTDAATLEFLTGTPHTVLRHPGAFNYARIVNRAVRHTDTPLVLLLNNDVAVLSPDWLLAMVEQATQPDVGVVGARLMYPDGRVQHEGIAIGYSGVPAVNLDWGGYFAMGEMIREASAVTAACALFRREVFDEVGGFDERLRVAYNDVDFCLRVAQRGYRVVYTPLAELEHAESASRGRLHPEADEAEFVARWGRPAEMRDPYLNPHIHSLAPLHLRLHGAP